MEDKRIFVLYGILIFAIIALVFGVVSLSTGNNKSKKNDDGKTTMKVGTTSRRTTTSTEYVETTTSETTEVIPTEPTSDQPGELTTIPTTLPTTPGTTTTKKITTKTTTKKTTAKKTTRKTTTRTLEVPSEERETTETNSGYDLAQSDIEWLIFDRINLERERNGYNYVKMAVDFRRWAEEGADLQYDKTAEEVRQYLYGLNNYRRISNHIETPEKAALSMYAATIANTPVITDPDIRYVGIGVIFREIGLGDRPTYYYVIIYE